MIPLQGGLPSLPRGTTRWGLAPQCRPSKSVQTRCVYPRVHGSQRVYDTSLCAPRAERGAGHLNSLPPPPRAGAKRGSVGGHVVESHSSRRACLWGMGLERARLLLHQRNPLQSWCVRSNRSCDAGLKNLWFSWLMLKRRGSSFVGDGTGCTMARPGWN